MQVPLRNCHLSAAQAMPPKCRLGTATQVPLRDCHLRAEAGKPEPHPHPLTHTRTHRHITGHLCIRPQQAAGRETGAELDRRKLRREVRCEREREGGGGGLGGGGGCKREGRMAGKGVAGKVRAVCVCARAYTHNTHKLRRAHTRARVRAEACVRRATGAGCLVGGEKQLRSSDSDSEPRGGLSGRRREAEARS